MMMIMSNGMRRWGCKMRARMRKIMMVMTRVKTTMRMMVSAPSELLFFTLKESGEVGFISLTGAQSHDLTLAGRSSHPSAVTYDPIEQIYTTLTGAYWSQSHISPMTP